MTFINALAPTGLAAFRDRAGVSQAAMAKAMQMPLRTYEDLEAGRSKIRPIHVKAAQMALIDIAAETKNASVLYAALANRVTDVAALVKEQAS